MHRKIHLLIGVLLLTLLCGCTQQTAVEPPELLEPVGVQEDTAKAWIGSIEQIQQYSAYAAAYTEGVGFENDGSVSAVYAYSGKWVEEGEILVELDQNALTERADSLREEIGHAERVNAYEDAAAQLRIDQMTVELRQMQANYADAVQIALKKNEIASAQAALRQAQQLRQPELVQKRQELAQIEEQLNKNVLRAPFSGRVVSMQKLSVGTQVKAYDEIVFIADESRLSLIGDFVPESMFGGAVRLYARIGTQEYEIEVQPVDVQEQVRLSLSGGTMKTRYSFTDNETDLSGVQAGDYAVICVVKSYVPDALLLPAGAVLQDSDGCYVYAEENGERVRRRVSVGVMNDAMVQITEGLGEGAVVYVQD